MLGQGTQRDAPTFTWQTGGPPVLHRITIVKLLTQHVVKRRLLGTHQWRSAFLVVGLPVTEDWFEMGCHLSPSLISIRLTACRTFIPRKRRGNHKQTTTSTGCFRSYRTPIHKIVSSDINRASLQNDMRILR